MRYSIAATFAIFVVVFAAIPEARSAPVGKVPMATQIRRNGMFTDIVSTLNGHVMGISIALRETEA